VLVPPMLLSAGTLMLQSQTFADMKYASEFAAQVAEPGAEIYTNEYYNAKIPVVKVPFWAGRDVAYDPTFARFRRHQMDPLTEEPPLTPEERLAVGDLIVFSTLYAGPPPAEILYLSYLGALYEYEIINQFPMTIVPLLTDVMHVPGAHGNPLAWFYRYQPQGAQTLVIRIVGVHAS